MKRFLAMALATAMTMSMASVAFAASANLRVPMNGANPVVTNVRFEWNNDDDAKYVQKESKDYEPGDTIYYALRGVENGNTSAPVYESEAVKGLKLKPTWDLGKEAVSGVSLVKKKIKADDFKSGSNVFDTTDSLQGARSYAYFIGVTTKQSMKTGDVDISGKIELSKSETKNNNVLNGDKVDKAILYVDATIHYEKSGVDGDWVVGKDRKTFKFDNTEDEQELEIINSDTATFTVDTRGQGKIVLSANNDFNAAISAKYPNANLDFITIEASDSFNRIGTLRVFTPDGDKYLYALDKNGNITNANAKYDSADECYVMRTRTLGSFVLSDEELNVKAPEVDTPSVEVPEVKPNNNKPFNPGTGAAC